MNSSIMSRASIKSGGSNFAGQVWLRLNWNPRGENPVVFFFNTETSQTRWDPPQEPDKISSIQSLQEQLRVFASKVKGLDDPPTERGSMLSASIAGIHSMG